MTRFFLIASLISILCVGSMAATGADLWHEIPSSNAPSREIQVFHPREYRVYTFNEVWLKLQMFSLSTSPEDAMIVELPLPNGNYRSFRVWQCPMMHQEMADKYPEIKTFSAVAVDDQRVTAKLDFTIYGFHAMILDGENTSFIDPYDRYHDGFYMAHYKRDEVRDISARMKCEVKGTDENGPAGESMDIAQKGLPKLAYRTMNGWNLRTYDLALSADSWYCAAATGLTTPTIVASLSCMTTTMNRINGIYEKEFSIHMNFCAKEDTLIWPTRTGSINGTDPFYSIDANGASCMSANQTQCTNRIGSANYDLGHVFTTGGGGISSLGVVCSNSQKARSCTGQSTPVGDGFDLDYVAHEMGHEFGANHTFNNDNDGSCGTNANTSTAYEPGSGATIMDYAGICSPDDLQYHSDAYFGFASLKEINALLLTSENTCATSTATGNKPAGLAAYTTSYTIPYKTPFEFTGPTAVDSVADTSTTYCWAQCNLGDFGKRMNQTFLRGPIFRSYLPVKNPTRIFPKLSMILNGTLSNAGTEGAEGEKVPDTARYMTFKMTVRTILGGHGCYLVPDDTIHIDAVANSTFKGFSVTSQGTTGITYSGGTPQVVTWAVAGSDLAPVSAAFVNIYMSTDGGQTFSYFLGKYPNTGTATVTIANPLLSSGNCRIKVKGYGNVFFNINGKNFTVNHNTAVATSPSGITQAVNTAAETNIYPVPATGVLHIDGPANNLIQAIAYNAMGQLVWQGAVNGPTEINVSAWAKGIYHIKLMNTNDAGTTVKSIVIQ